MQSAEETFENAMGDEFYVNIVYKVCNKNLRSVCTDEEIKSIAMSTLWRCSKKYNPSKSTAKFSSYLYRSVENNSRRIYKKKIKIKKETSVEKTFFNMYEYDDSDRINAMDILDSLEYKDKELYNIIIQKFFYNMTNLEIGNINGYGKESARKKVKKALELCREIVYN